MKYFMYLINNIRQDKNLLRFIFNKEIGRTISN
jgi:hypothetical protein